MPQVGLVRAFVALWWTAGFVLFYLSVRTAHQGLGSGSSHDPHLVLLGGFEALAALLFLAPGTLRVGAGGLLLALSGAFLVYALHHQLRGDLLVYGAVVLFVAVHGAVPMSWLRRKAVTPG